MGLKILVVEDEDLVAMLVQDMVEEVGHKVVATAARLERAMTNAAQASIDFAILDLNLHGHETYEVAAVLSERKIPFIFTTGYSDDGIDQNWRNVPTVLKPFQSMDLLAAIDRATQA
jgi:CheY-like chemotaxis protein